MERVLNLKEHHDLIPQYVELRNSYCELLLTQPVEVAETIQWMQNTSVQLRVIEEEYRILGVALLYPDRGGEVAFFARQKNKGIGTRLLEEIDGVAMLAKLPLIWAWVRDDNFVAAKVFEKCGYLRSGREGRIYKEQLIRGIRYTKVFSEIKK